MVDSNCQRTKVFPSERAFTYEMKLEAMKRQGKRSDLTSAHVAQKLTRKTSRQILAEQEGQSQDQIRRYIRLTSLVPELLEFVDLENIKLCPAVELSYLDEKAQRDVVDQTDETAAFPSHAQTIRMRKAFEQGKLDHDLAKAIMNRDLLKKGSCIYPVVPFRHYGHRKKEKSLREITDGGRRDSQFIVAVPLFFHIFSRTVLEFATIL